MDNTTFDIKGIVRKNILELKPYSSARDEFKGEARIFLDANENSFGSPLPGTEELQINRYPDPLQMQLKKKISAVKGVPVQNIFVGNGSDEAIDLLFRIFCIPEKDNAIIFPPTYGMYEVAANINNIEVQKVNLTPEDFQLNVEETFNKCNNNTKLIFICCPNNPTGNGVKWNDIKKILDSFNGIVVVDEAYVNFASYQSLIGKLVDYPNLVILQTLSKAWGMAGLRIGMAFASEAIIELFNKVKPPYNVNTVSQQMALEALNEIEEINSRIKSTVQERIQLSEKLKQFRYVKKVYPSEANFLLVKVVDSKKLYDYLAAEGIVVRDRSKVALCEGCLRITIGTPEENKLLLESLERFDA